MPSSKKSKSIAAKKAALRRSRKRRVEETLARFKRRAKRERAKSRAKAKSKAKSKEKSKEKSKSKQITLSPKISKKIQEAKEYQRKHRLLKLTDFTNLQPGQIVHLSFIYDEAKIIKVAFKFDHIAPAPTKQKKWITHYIYGKSRYTAGLPLSVTTQRGEIRYSESQDTSPAYLDKPIIIDRNIKPEKKRQSPSESATINKVGTKKQGNDGNMWIVVETVSGVKRWKAIKK